MNYTCRPDTASLSRTRGRCAASINAPTAGTPNGGSRKSPVGSAGGARWFGTFLFKGNRMTCKKRGHDRRRDNWPCVVCQLEKAEEESTDLFNWRGRVTTALHLPNEISAGRAVEVIRVMWRLLKCLATRHEEVHKFHDSESNPPPPQILVDRVVLAAAYEMVQETKEQKPPLRGPCHVPPLP